MVIIPKEAELARAILNMYMWTVSEDGETDLYDLQKEWQLVTKQVPWLAEVVPMPPMYEPWTDTTLKDSGALDVLNKIAVGLIHK